MIQYQQPVVNQTASIANLDMVAVAMEKLTGRVQGLPGMGVLYGPPGYGKTVAASAIALATRGYYVQMRSAWSRKTLLEKIIFEMGAKPSGTIPVLLDQICEQLATSGRPLLIDEFDFALRSDAMVELVRDIYEGSQGTILLVGGGAAAAAPEKMGALPQPRHGLDSGLAGIARRRPPASTDLLPSCRH